MSEEVDLDIPNFLRRTPEPTVLDIDAIRGDMAPAPEHSFTTYEAIKIKWAQSIEGNVLTLRLHFDQDTSAIANLPLGKKLILAIAEDTREGNAKP